MKQILAAVYDHKAEFYSRPQMYHTEAAAIRDFGEAARNPESYIYSHPEDYTFYAVATFDDTTGEITPIEPRKSLGTAIQYVNPVSENFTDSGLTNAQSNGQQAESS